MIRGIYKSSSAMQLLTDRMDVTANNLANVNTAGFKRKGVLFRQIMDAEQALQRNQIDPVNKSLTNYPVRDFKKINDPQYDNVLPQEKPFLPSNHLHGEFATYTDLSLGGIKQTDNPLDVALTSKGFFAIETSDGVSYTRDGQFKLSENGYLVNSDGYLVLGEAGPIEITGTNVEITNQGEIIQDGLIVNKFIVKDFEDAELSSQGKSLLRAKNGQTGKEISATMKQGFIEISNVNTVKEMVGMISTHRNYDANAKALKAIDESLQKSVNMLGK